MASKKAIMRLQLDGVAKQALDDMCEKKGMTQIAFLSRLVEWFANQEEIIQVPVLVLVSDQPLAELSQINNQRLTAKPPAALLAVKVEAAATPALLVFVVKLVRPFENVPPGPDAGARNVPAA